MKKMLTLFLTLFVAGGAAWGMDGDDVVRLLRNRTDERTILATAQRSPLRLNARDIQSIRNAGGSEYLIQNLAATSRPPVVYTAPVMIHQTPGRPVGHGVDKNSTLFEIVNHSGIELTAEINHSARRILLRDGGRGGMRLPVNGTVRVTVQKGNWDIRFEGQREDGEVKMRGGERTSMTLEPRSPHGGLVARVDDSERVRVVTLIPDRQAVVVRPAPAPVVIHQPAPVVVQQPRTVIVEPNPVIVTPAPIIRPGPPMVVHQPPPQVITAVPAMPPVVVAQPPAPKNSLNINLSFGNNSKRR